jgi:hypothetical protein
MKSISIILLTGLSLVTLLTGCATSDDALAASFLLGAAGINSPNPQNAAVLGLASDVMRTDAQIQGRKEAAMIASPQANRNQGGYIEGPEYQPQTPPQPSERPAAVLRRVQWWGGSLGTPYDGDFAVYANRFEFRGKGGSYVIMPFSSITSVTHYRGWTAEGIVFQTSTGRYKFSFLGNDMKTLTVYFQQQARR